ncbi:hypothetical protein SAMN05444064_11491 [Pseudomonas syringae]|nr:hypothetical protein SAMN05444514_11391 [Pseudomonas syringae]SFM33597.1 hypothetical protein SAMN05444064_11491 [Pseudomonas syringae]
MSTKADFQPPNTSLKKHAQAYIQKHTIYVMAGLTPSRTSPLPRSNTQYPTPVTLCTAPPVGVDLSTKADFQPPNTSLKKHAQAYIQKHTIYVMAGLTPSRTSPLPRSNTQYPTPAILCTAPPVGVDLSTKADYQTPNDSLKLHAVKHFLRCPGYRALKFDVELTSGARECMFTLRHDVCAQADTPQ